MSNFRYLTLDTTGPVLTINAPNFTTKGMLTYMTIESNEALSPYQEIYFIDSSGARHDLSFRHDGNQFSGTIIFGNYEVPLGIGTLYARLEDEVGNISDQVSKTLEIREHLTSLRLDILDNSFKMVRGEAVLKPISNSEQAFKMEKKESVLKTVREESIFKIDSDTRSGEV